MNSKRDSRVHLGLTIVCCFLVLTCSDQKSSPSPILGLVNSAASDTVGSDSVGTSGVSRAVAPSLGSSPYLVGAGIYDITGPAAEVGMMGFAESAQKTEGIYMRLWSRAYIIGDASKRVVFVSADLGMVFQSIKQAVSRKIALDSELSPYYNQANVLLSATHTHSGPGGS